MSQGFASKVWEERCVGFLVWEEGSELQHLGSLGSSDWGNEKSD